jgi:hypothetical protein
MRMKIEEFFLAREAEDWHSKVVKRWPYILILLIAVGIGVYFLIENQRLLPSSWRWGASTGSENAGTETDSLLGATQPAQISWHVVSRPADGFRVEMPSGPRDSEVPALNESGGTEPVKMLHSSPGDDSTYAVTWADNPPVARANDNDPDRTLDHARDGMLANTETSLVSETRITVAGFPGREILAHNSAGGMLNARLIYVPAAGNGAGGRLYTLMALFPTAGARSEQDVSRFFNSFAPGSVAPKS